jgi:hypothetical protein
MMMMMMMMPSRTLGNQLASFHWYELELLCVYGGRSSFMALAYLRLLNVLHGRSVHATAGVVSTKAFTNEANSNSNAEHDRKKDVEAVEVDVVSVVVHSADKDVDVRGRRRRGG